MVSARGRVVATRTVTVSLSAAVVAPLARQISTATCLVALLGLLVALTGRVVARIAGVVAQLAGIVAALAGQIALFAGSVAPIADTVSPAAGSVALLARLLALLGRGGSALVGAVRRGRSRSRRFTAAEDLGICGNHPRPAGSEIGVDLGGRPMTLLRHEALSDYSVACEGERSATVGCSNSIESGPIACVRAIMRLLYMSQTCSLPDCLCRCAQSAEERVSFTPWSVWVGLSHRRLGSVCALARPACPTGPTGQRRR